MAEEYDYLFKSIVVGDGGVGKTALTLRFSKGFFTEDYKMTIGVDFHVKTITIETAEGPIRTKLQLWDTGGQERFSSIRPMYYRGSLGTVLVFDLTNISSFEHLPQWIEEVRANVKSDIPLLLVGNKSDLIDQRVVSLEEINTFTRNFNLYYMETSAKTGDGVGDCFYILACLMIGSGVPDQLIARGTVFNPGQIITDASASVASSSPEPVMTQQDNFVAPPVPEPAFEPAPELEYEAPPVPEPPPKYEPEVEYEAPPVPEPQLPPEPSTSSIFEPVNEPEVPVPEPEDFEFKMPNEILGANTSEPKTPPSFSLPPTTSSTEEAYKPKAVPFSDNIPVPAPPPDGFPVPQSPKEDSTSTSTPFTVAKKEEPSKPKPATMSFQPEPTPTTSIPTTNPIFQTETDQAKESTSDSLVDYMAGTILSKKEKKRLAKEQKRKEKEKHKKEKETKLQQEREKQEKLIEDMKKGKKDKKKAIEPETDFSTITSIQKEEAPSSDTTNLFQALSQKPDDAVKSDTSAFVPFMSKKEAASEETSSLRIIPNVNNVETEPTGFTVISPSDSNDMTGDDTASKSSDLLVCGSCGAVLSSDYIFCNKCGNKL